MNKKTYVLHAEDHDRNIFDSKYVYPVVSRRAGGLSLGVNLNTNNACNWQCIYCEIPNLTRGGPEPIQVEFLKDELNFWIDQIINSNFLKENTPPGTTFADVALSGNGEPTAAPEFLEVLEIIIASLKEHKLIDKIPVRLITNGSFISKKIECLNIFNRYHGEVWFKIDAADEGSIKLINQVNLDPNSMINNLKKCAEACQTVIQTCLLKINHQVPTNDFLKNYSRLIKPYEKLIKKIDLYSLARPSLQNNQDISIERLSLDELNHIKNILQKQLTIKIDVFP
ncbi:radical SAM protein [Methylophilales bacterium MBRSG12]|uniref:Radical SAM protein n=1 Tax=Methylophilales bacterium MBRS-H7 TaxID=1623450 RepID=A0A0H4IZD1_9PROT|nr:radical SAM protein [Methylophilales bacterium MBRSF5]AKO65854.1 radical SAM protein [Methylophilales bacterium MBRS-H7]AKO67174.1 radical SAM protein [Methylophilales bacterium MBRSG12]